MEPADCPQNSRTKRPRASQACENCRVKKYKCNELYPCSQCERKKTNCIYHGAENIRKRLASSTYAADLERRVEELSRQVREYEGMSKAQGRHDVNPGSGAPQESGISLGQYESITGPAERFVIGKSRLHRPVTLRSDEESQTSDNDSVEEIGTEVRDVNHYTQNMEYHGNTSSMAFLARVHSQSELPAAQTPSQEHAEHPKQSLVSKLHNVAFSPHSHLATPTTEGIPQGNKYYFRQSRIFIDGYFETLHFIHPILSKEVFLTRCEDLWFERPEKQPRSFVALYYSLLSLGALVRTWEEDLIEGMDRFQWSRKLFDHAREALGDLGSITLDKIQTYILMAKVSQNMLNPNLAYMYLGVAVRASLSAGYNREPVASIKPKSAWEAEDDVSKTWWGLFSLEVETSFALGRPDTLGLDQYHNRRIPALDASETAILPAMLDFAHITRRVSMALYLSKSSIREKIAAAEKIQEEMCSWLQSLPAMIRPYMSHDQTAARIMKDPKWARRQRLVLQIRFLNVKMVLYRPFLVYASKESREVPLALQHAISSCVDAARETAETMHDCYRKHEFFRTWWYNTTYTIYSASILLSYVAQAAPSAEMPALFRLVEMTIEVLEVMKESVVAQRAAEMIKQALAHARNKAQTTQTMADQRQLFSAGHTTSQDSANFGLDAMLDTEMAVAQPMHMDNIFDLEESLFTDVNQFMFWTDLNSAAGGFSA